MLDQTLSRNLNHSVRHFTYSASGGAGRIAAQISKIQQDDGIDSQLLCDAEGGVRKDFFQHPVRGVEAIFDYYGVRRNRNAPLFSLFRNGTAGWIQGKKSERKFLAHLHWTPGVLSMADLLFLAKNNIPTVWTLHDMWPVTGGCHHSLNCTEFERECATCPQAKSLFAGRVEEQLIRKREFVSAHPALIFVAPSKWMKNQAERSSISQGTEIKVIPNPIEIKPYLLQDKELNRRNLGIPLESFVVGCAAVDLSDPIKNIREIVEIVHGLARRTSRQVQLVAIGEGEPPGGFDKNVKRLGLLASTEKLAQAYSTLDVFLSTSMIETFPTTLLEASATGVPSIVYPNGGMADLIIDGHNGFLVKDVAEATEKLLTVHSRPEYLATLGMRARQIVASTYNLQTIGNLYTDVYSEVIDRARKSPR